MRVTDREARLEEIEKRRSRVFPRPWTLTWRGYGGRDVPDHIYSDDGGQRQVCEFAVFRNKRAGAATARFIAHAPEDIDWLLSEIDRLSFRELHDDALEQARREVEQATIQHGADLRKTKDVLDRLKAKLEGEDMADTAQEQGQTQSLSEAEQEFVRAAMAKVGQDLIAALWELPGFEHTKGNSVVEDVLDLAERLRARQREEDFVGKVRLARALNIDVDPEHPDFWDVVERDLAAVLDATPQQEGEREPESDDLGRTPMESLRDHAREVANEIDEWGDVAPPHIHALIEVAKRALYTEPPAMREPDLDELTPKCPACRETMHDCECNPYMDTEGDERG